MIYVVSDLHGQWQPFHDGLETIGFTDSDQLYVIGDAIDRGFESIKILSEIKNAPNMDLLIGNHEFLMLSSVDPRGGVKCTGKDSDLWLDDNGGGATFEEYVGLPKRERIELLNWLNSRMLITEVSVSGKDYVFCHTFYIPDYTRVPYKDVPSDKVWHIVWDSLFRDDTRAPDIYCQYPEKTFVTGHVPVQYIQGVMNESVFERLPSSLKIGNLINIDGGLSWGHMGVANAAIFLRLDDMEEFVIPFDHTSFEDFRLI